MMEGHKCPAKAIEAPIKPREVEPKIPKGVSYMLSQL